MCDKPAECPGHVVECARCDGNGVTGFGTTPCATCGGVGSVLLKAR